VVSVDRLTDDMVRSAVYHWLRKNDPELFDAWLNQVKAEAWVEGAETVLRHENIAGFFLWPENPYRKGKQNNE
jgi:hypothetical protein